MKAAWFVVVSGFACWHSQPVVEPPAVDSPVDVSVSSVTLGDDCGEGVFEAEGRGVADDMLDECIQTAMQLMVKASDQPASLRIKRVELVAPDGDVLVLGAHSPTQWTQKPGMYKPWDQRIEANAALQVSYALDTPDWAKLGGRWAAQTKTFQVRVTVAIDSRERVFETRAQVAAMMEPMIET
jgi:hypothetical protein